MRFTIAILLFAAFAISSCSQHLCPTYQNSGAKWHKHNSHPTTHHH